MTKRDLNNYKIQTLTFFFFFLGFMIKWWEWMKDKHKRPNQPLKHYVVPHILPTIVNNQFPYQNLNNFFTLFFSLPSLSIYISIYTTHTHLIYIYMQTTFQLKYASKSKIQIHGVFNFFSCVDSSSYIF